MKSGFISTAGVAVHPHDFRERAPAFLSDPLEISRQGAASLGVKSASDRSLMGSNFSFNFLSPWNSSSSFGSQMVR